MTWTIIYILFAITGALYQTNITYHKIIKPGNQGKIRSLIAILITFAVSFVVFPLLVLDFIHYCSKWAMKKYNKKERY